MRTRECAQVKDGRVHAVTSKHFSPKFQHHVRAPPAEEPAASDPGLPLELIASTDCHAAG